MIDLEKKILSLRERRPVFVMVCLLVACVFILLAIAWFLLFSGLNTSADFVYNQF
ncbi:MAG: hypothetical protein FWG24_06040 [Eggerthellaceae bacterium]|nr:hypothetical protein [Eggerthellaceae bacterium]